MKQRVLSWRALLPQFRERPLDPREDRGLSELQEYPLSLGEMLNRKRALLLGLVEEAENHLRVACVMTLTVEMLIVQELTH